MKVFLVAAAFVLGWSWLWRQPSEAMLRRCGGGRDYARVAGGDRFADGNDEVHHR